MRRDIRGAPAYAEVEGYFRAWLEPGFGTVTGGTDPHPSPDGSLIAFAGARMDALEGTPTSRVCVASVAQGRFDQVTNGPNDDRLPRWSPDGRRLAFISDRAEKGRFQLYLLEGGRVGEALAAPPVDGTVESLSWSPDGSKVLLGVAGLGAEKSGAEGSGVTGEVRDELPSWIPQVDEGVGEEDWRRVWVYDVAEGTVRPASREGLNVWEAAWCGPDRVAAIVSEDPGEGAWYEAPLAIIDLASGKERELYRSPSSLRQVGLPAASPDGRSLAAVQACCSDRGIVAGEVLLVDPESGETRPVDTLGVDVTHLRWRDDGRLLFAGVRDLETVVGEVDGATGQARELWTSAETAGFWEPAAEPLGPDDGFALVLESYDRPPTVAVVQDGAVREVASLANAGTDHLRSIAGTLEPVRWTAPDGLELEGYLARPGGSTGGPLPTILFVHGGPVSRYRSVWAMGRGLVPLLVSRGYAVFMPNPRGSTGHGQAFIEMVVGDMGGADAKDVLAGLDALVGSGVADPSRLGVIGGSYGGFMSAWLVTQDERFAAAVPISPVTDYASQHWTSNIGFWDRIFIGEDPWIPGGQYHARSPVMFARRVRTPVLQTAGGVDRCTPPGQAVEFHQALLEAGVESEIAIYPQEGHGVRSFPAALDFATRVLTWFERHMPARTGGAGAP